MPDEDERGVAGDLFREFRKRAEVEQQGDGDRGKRGAN
jgi:hypothetical protein